MRRQLQLLLQSKGYFLSSRGNKVYSNDGDLVFSDARGITYTLPEEGGASLRASGWLRLGTTPGKSWSVPSRPREDKHPLGQKDRWGFGAWPELTPSAKETLHDL